MGDSQNALESTSESSRENEMSGTPYLTSFSNAAFTIPDVCDKMEEILPPRVNTLPINRVGILSYMFCSWFSEFVLGTFRNQEKPLSQADVWRCSEQEGIKANTENMKKIWNKEIDLNSRNASFFNVLVHFTKRRCFINFAILVIYICAAFTTSAILVKNIVSYLESDHQDLLYGSTWAIVIFICEIIRALALNNCIIFGCQTATRVRSGMIGLLYDKLLRMKSMNGQTNSEIINLFSVDSQRIYLFTSNCVIVLGFPLYFVISFVYCYLLIEYWSFVAIGTVAACHMAQMYLVSFSGNIRSKCAQFADKRIRRVTEVIKNMRFIKMGVLETPLVNIINDIRKPEEKYLFYRALLTNVSGCLIPIAPTIASVVTISVCAFTGYQLIASTVFAVIGTLNFLSGGISRVSMCLRLYTEAKVSFERIQRILLLEEYSKPDTEVNNEGNVVEIKNANFVWFKPLDANSGVFQVNNNVNKSECDELENVFELSNISFEAKKGNFIGICGQVGSGKSAFLSAILGRMFKKNGRLAVNGSIAYVSQQAWIFNATLKENILFGSQFDPERYDRVIKSCCLVPDIEDMPDGHNTEIGENGVNLSGGQKQRVSLARAIYGDKDIYIIDDSLSALDDKVGKQVFQECMLRLLKKKTVLFVTNHLQYLKTCDEILVINKGMIIQKGLHQDLLNAEGLYAEMFNNCTESTNQSHCDVVLNGSAREAIGKDCVSGGGGMAAKFNKGQERAFIKNEVPTVGHVKCGTYLAYIRAAGGWGVVSCVLLVQLIISASIVFSDWWLSKWISSESIKPLDTILNISTTQSQTASNSSINDTNGSTRLGQPQDLFINWNISHNMHLVVYSTSIVGILVLLLIGAIVGAKVTWKTSHQIHKRCLSSVMGASMSFFDTTPVGRILNRFSKDLDEIDVFLPQNIRILLQWLSLSIISLLVSIYVTPWFLTAIVPIVIAFCFLKKITSVTIRQMKRFDNISRSPLLSSVSATTNGLVTIVASEKQDHLMNRFTKIGNVSSVSSFLCDISVQWIGIRLDLLTGSMTVATTLIFVFTKGLVQPASAGLVLSLFGKIIGILQYLLILSNNAEANFTAVERIQEYSVKLPPDNEYEGKVVGHNWPINPKVVFNNVNMRYQEEDECVLRSVSFEIHPKEKVWIVGRTGAGKTSLAAALLRLVKLESGSIYVDGEDISKLNLRFLRSKIATITQEPVLFAGSLRFNIDPFRFYTDEEIWSALENVHIKEKIKLLGKGLEAEIEENGSNFSVGERQQLCMARAVLEKCKIILLDEASASIDLTTDALIQDAIKECFANCTVITIAHRLNAIRNSDKVIVLDSGQVRESGSVEELLSSPNSYLRALIPQK